MPRLQAHDHQDKGDEDVESIASVLTTLQLNKGLPAVAKPPWQDALAAEFGVMSMQVKLGVYLKTRDERRARSWRERASKLLLSLNYQSDLQPQAVTEQHLLWGKEMRRRLGPATPRSAFNNSKAPDRVLRVGYISPDLKSHVVSMFLRGPVRDHDRSKIHVTCYSTTHLFNTDNVTEFFRTQANVFRDVSTLEADAILSLVKDDEIDILVELAGHTSGVESRLDVMAMRAAPIQVSWIGYPNTTGLDSIDYRITDGAADAEDTRQFFPEKLVRLPHTFLTFDDLPLGRDSLGVTSPTQGYIYIYIVG